MAEPVLFTPEGLVGGECSSCGRRHFPVAPWCPWCGAEGPVEVVLSTEGRLWSWTTVLAPPPGYDGPVPYPLAVVDLPADGLRVVTRLTDVDEPYEGMALRFAPTPVTEALETWSFAPDLHPSLPNPEFDDAAPANPVPDAPAPGTRVTGAGVRVRVVGTGLYPFGRHDVGLAEMGARAVKAALEEAENPRVDGVFCGTAYGGVATGHRVVGMLGLTGVPIVDVEAGCASGAAALQLAADAIRSGRHDTVLVVGVEKMPKGVIRSSYFEPWREALGLTPAPAFFALRARRLMIDHGVTKEQLAAVVVKNRAAGVDNPDAMFRKAVTVEEVLASRPVCDPLHLFMLCSPNEGAAALVLQRGRAGVQVRACALRSHRPGHVLDESTPLAGLIGEAGEPTPPTTAAARDAYDEAGLGPGDLDLVECQDTDAAREIGLYGELGLCDLADVERFLREPTTPVNRSGGLLSKGEPLGASAVAQVVELVRQLEGRAGARQVDGARIGLAQTIGRGANASVTILST